MHRATVPIRQLGNGQTRHLELPLNSPGKDGSGARQSVHLETTLLRFRALKARVKDAVRRGPPTCIIEVWSAVWTGLGLGFWSS